MGHNDAQISLMEKAIEVYSADPSSDWIWEKESKLLLAEALAIAGEKERALALFEEITDGNPAPQSETVAQAYERRMGLRDDAPSKSWNSSHPTRSCSQDDLKATGGNGFMYCFAAR